ncbi:MAG: hypothetical protein EKK55_25030 [Rhodocyclaceae bacterium]|nr:MAG: hypothetical protein EKK55_25030 [Rhodocyclaceae bacterium]
MRPGLLSNQWRRTHRKRSFTRPPWAPRRRASAAPARRRRRRAARPARGRRARARRAAVPR